MPNQEMPDRMPEVSQETIDKTLARQIEGLQRKVEHRECEQRIVALEAEKEALHGALGEAAAFLHWARFSSAIDKADDADGWLLENLFRVRSRARAAMKRDVEAALGEGDHE